MGRMVEFLEDAGLVVDDLHHGWTVRPAIVERAFAVQISIAPVRPWRWNPYRCRLEGRYDADREAFTDTFEALCEKHGRISAKRNCGIEIAFDDFVVEIGYERKHRRDTFRLTGSGHVGPGRGNLPTRTSAIDDYDELLEPARIAGGRGSYERAKGLVEEIAGACPVELEGLHPCGRRLAATHIAMSAGKDSGSFLMFMSDEHTWDEIKLDEACVPDWLREAVQVHEARFPIFTQEVRSGHHLARIALPQSAILRAATGISLRKRRRDLARRMMRIGAPGEGALSKLLKTT